MSIEKIFLLHHTHVDLGYTDTRGFVERKLIGMMDTSLDLVKDSANRAEPERFRWIHEVSWPVIRYLGRANARAEELFRFIREGRMELTAFHVHPTDLFDRHLVEYSTRFALNLAREHQLPLDTAMFSDCPGIAGNMPDYLSGIGIRYLSAGPNFIMSCPLEVERPFYWEGPRGGRVLTWFTDWHLGAYGEGGWLMLHEDPVKAHANLMGYIRKLESEGYRWKGLAIHFASDNKPPKPELMDFVKHWNRTEPRIEVRMAINRDFFSYMEKEHGGQFAVHRGVWPDWWANGHGSAAYEVSCSRQAKVILQRSKALAGSVQCGTQPCYQAAYERAMNEILMFDEHTWGNSGTADMPWSPKVRLGWQEKRAYAMRGFLEAKCIERDLLAQIAPGKIVLFNPGPETYTGPVRLESVDNGRIAPQIVAQGAGSVLDGQRVAAGRIGAGDWYTVTIPAGATRILERQGRSKVKPGQGALENEWFRISADPTTGRITSVFDKTIKVELVDPNAPWAFAELIHEKTVSALGRNVMYDPQRGGTWNPESKRPCPAFIRKGGDAKSRAHKIISGPVFTALMTRGQLPHVAFEREIRLYHGNNRMDVRLRLDKSIWVDYESLYFAFPFCLGRPEVWVENAGAVYRAGKDQLPGSATDWLSLGDYVALTDGNTTVIVVPHDSPLIQLGDINTGRWLKRLEIKNGHVYSWVMNNMWYTNFPACQEGCVELTWSIVSHPGSFDRRKAERFSSAARIGLAVGG